ncbi:VOC family protein [Virgibacillus necropolis]|uniref:VOC family protein n=1 Tax=Virgibacillus necropolis TaxID=163877 RepID=UPI0038510ADE
MKGKLHRVGTIYIPVSDPGKAAEWYREKLDAKENFRNDEKAIMDFANQSFFLVKAKSSEKLNFTDDKDNEHFTVTFEVNGLMELEKLHKAFMKKGINVGDIEDRGHPGRNFVFYDLDRNKFDVWSELSPDFKERYQID